MTKHDITHVLWLVDIMIIQQFDQHGNRRFVIKESFEWGKHLFLWKMFRCHVLFPKRFGISSSGFRSTYQPERFGMALRL